MFLSKRKNGFWYIYYEQRNGKRSCISTKAKLKSEALKFLANFEGELKDRKGLKVIPINLQNFRTEYLKYSESIHRPKTTKQVNSILNEFVKYFGNPQLYEIPKKSVSNYLQQKSKISPYTAQKHLAYLSSAFNKAIENGYLETNPCKGIKKFKLPEKQPLFFSEAELETLLRNVESQDLKDLIKFAVNSGLRQMELLTLEWKQINFKDNYLILDNSTNITKSQKIRTVPLNITALQILNKREINKTGEIVFTLNGKGITQSFISHKFKKYVKKSGLNPQLKFHSLRHTFASWLVQKGVSIFEVSKLLGHSDIKVTEIYSHLRAEDLLNSVNKLNN